MASRGLLTGLDSSFNRDLSRSATNLTETMLTGVGQLGAGIGGIVGNERLAQLDMRPERVKLKERFGQLTGSKDPNDRQELLQVMGKMGASPDVIAKYQMQFAAEDKALAQEDARKKALADQRKALVDSAKALRLTSTVEALQSGGSLEEAQKTIYKEQERNIVNRGGRKGKVAVAKSKNASPELIADIKSGKFDEMSDDLFIEQLEGKKASIKGFTAQDGTLQSRRVDESANVYNEATGKWESPVTLGLTPAPAISKVFNQNKAVADKLAGTLVDNFGELHTLAKDSQKILNTNNESLSALEAGIYTGFGANALLEISRVGKALGLVPQSVEDTTVATQTFMIERAKMVLPLIRALGSGTGISDTDRKFIANIVAAESTGIALDKETIRNIIRIENKYANEYIDRSNGALDTLKGLPNAGINSAMYDSLYVTKPEPFAAAPAVVNETPAVAPAYSPATLEYLQSKNLLPR